MVSCHVTKNFLFWKKNFLLLIGLPPNSDEVDQVINQSTLDTYTSKDTIYNII